MKGGHAKSGRIARTAAQQEAVGGKVRPRNRRQRTVGTKVVGVVSAPAHLGVSAKAYWRYYAPLLEQAELLTCEGRDALGKYCNLLATCQRIEKQMARRDYRDVVETLHGLKPNPLLTQLRQLYALARQYEADLLLNPSVRVRLPEGRNVPGAPAEEPAATDPNDDDFDFYGNDGRTGSAH